MKVEGTAPLVLDACINTLKERPINTRYHPENDNYIIDAYMMARIIWHNSDLKAEVTGPEAMLCDKFIRALIDQEIVSSVLTSNKYIIKECNGKSRRTILVRKKKFLEKRGVGRAPAFLNLPIDEGVKKNDRSISRN